MTAVPRLRREFALLAKRGNDEMCGARARVPRGRGRANEADGPRAPPFCRSRRAHRMPAASLRPSPSARAPRSYAKANNENLLDVHYVIKGPKDTVYEGGLYHGRLVFPPEYPMKPPSVLMITPNGRFEVNKRICFSFSDYHPESWNPVRARRRPRGGRWRTAGRGAALTPIPLPRCGRSRRSSSGSRPS